MFPLPNATDPSGTRQYNYQYEADVEKLRADQVLRVDWNIRPGTTFYSRVQFGHEVCGRGYVSGGAGEPVPAGRTGRRCGTPTTSTPSASSTRCIHSFNPITVLEVTAGLN